jgi:hypothetical protein
MKIRLAFIRSTTEGRGRDREHDGLPHLGNPYENFLKEVLPNQGW